MYAPNPFTTAKRLKFAFMVAIAAVAAASGPAAGDDSDRPSLAAYFASAADAATARFDTADSPLPDVPEQWLASVDHRPAAGSCPCGECSGYHWEFLPKDSLYPFYLADTKASRLAGQWLDSTGDHTLLDSTLGGRFGLLRYVDATPGPFKRGIQADVEGSAQVRLDMDLEHDVRSVDFRAGVPISVSFGRLQTRFGYYHLSSHVGDEFLIRYPTFDRKNYSRDVLFLGGASWLDSRTRVYGEMGWAFYSDVCDPWEFIFGIESAPRTPTGLRGAPFYAVNGRLREEVDFGGALTAQAGWAWRSSYSTGLLRAGLHYFNGKSNQFSFFDEHEELIGAGLWYDF